MNFNVFRRSQWLELARLFRNHSWERNDDGDVLIGHAKISGSYRTTAPDGLGEVVTTNLLTTEGINHLLSVGIAGGTATTTWYIVPIGANVAVADTWTYATAMGNGIAREDLVLYSELTRPAFVESVPANKSTNNTASPAVITSSADTQTIYGACLVSNSTKNNIASGVLLSAAKYSVARSLPTTGDELGIKYSLSLDNAA